MALTYRALRAGPGHGAASERVGRASGELRRHRIARRVSRAFTIPEDAYRAFLGGILDGLARQGFKNIIIVTATGGPQTLSSTISPKRPAAHITLERWSPTGGPSAPT